MCGPTILLVDDDEQIRELLVMYFSKDGYAVVEATNGIDAIQQVEQEKPDIILLDIMLPLLNGFEVCRQVRMYSRVPIVLMTALAERDSRPLGLELGANELISKPFSPRDVVRRVNALLQRISS
jgi:two-component system response regulator ResD